MNYDKDTLNREILFNSRKQFGMFGNIQWHVTKVTESYIEVQASSSRNDIDVGITGMNIVKSIRVKLPNTKVAVNWIKWKLEHGKGVLVENKGRTKEEIIKEIMYKLDN
jgi:hypothetical protein